jgi:hypothetical protein
MTFGKCKGPVLASSRDLTFDVRPPGSQPTAFVNARYVAPARIVLRNLRRVNLGPMAGTPTVKTSTQLFTERVSSQCGTLLP